MTSTFGLFKTPSFTINSAPPSSPSGGPSSAGWKINFTVPFISFFIEAKISAVPINMATWVSWPHACITPTACPLYSPITLEVKGKFTRSFTGSASISALSATTGPGFPPFKIPTTPVFATPV